MPVWRRRLRVCGLWGLLRAEQQCFRFSPRDSPARVKAVLELRAFCCQYE